MQNARAFFVLLSIGVWTLVLLPVQLVALGFGLRLASRLPQFYHRGNRAILGLELEVIGERVTAPPVLFTANHSSWLDIVVLSALIPGSFVAKHEVAGWPVVGLLAKLQRSVFIERRRQRAAAHRDEMRQRHEAGDLLILFPEATSNDGNRVLPFKSSFFAVAEEPFEGGALAVQPVSVAYTRLNKMPMGRRLRPLFAWYGDMLLMPHLWRLIGVGPVTAVVEFHPAVTIEDFSSRKALAQHCHGQVVAGVSRALSGRSRPIEAKVHKGSLSRGNLDSWGRNASVKW